MGGSSGAVGFLLSISTIFAFTNPHTNKTSSSSSFLSIFCSCTVYSWLQQQVTWIGGSVMLQHGLLQCMLGHRQWGGAQQHVVSVYLYVFMHRLMKEGQFLKTLNCLSDMAVPTPETEQWWQNFFSVLCDFSCNLSIKKHLIYIYKKLLCLFLSPAPVGCSMSRCGCADNANHTPTWWTPVCPTDCCWGTLFFLKMFVHVFLEMPYLSSLSLLREQAQGRCRPVTSQRRRGEPVTSQLSGSLCLILVPWL